MKRILCLTSTRADYGIQRLIYKKIEESAELELMLVVTGMHLSYDFGYTLNEIEADGFSLLDKIEILGDLSDKARLPKEMAKLSARLGEIILDNHPDLMLILGDRYEMLAAASTALLMHLPIAHISGGEITEGAIDNQIRNAISQMAQIHFPGAKEYAKNLIEMGIPKESIFCVGDPGIENIKKLSFLTVEELEQELNVKIDNSTLLITYHPVTLELDSLNNQIDSLINALKDYNGPKIITYPNSDEGSQILINKLEDYAKKDSSVKLVQNLGSRRYISLMKYCGAVIGNSSSAIIEAPFFKKPVVNIGNRQKGRLMADCIINTGNSQNEIATAIATALSSEFQKIAKESTSLYGEGDTSQRIVDVLAQL